MSNEEVKQTIIIVRKRRGDGEDDHHGGVWKLAFADFMTAMMAFFLVMWLINSTSKETKAAIVQYFNPVQLVDSNPARKGLRDPKESGQGTSLQQTEDDKEAAGSDTSEQKKQSSEAALHREPGKALEEIAKRDAPAISPNADRPANPALADPFDRFDPSQPAADAPREEWRSGGASQQGGVGESAENIAPGEQSISSPLQQNDAADRRTGAEPLLRVSETPKSIAQLSETIQAALENAIRLEAHGKRAVPRMELKQTDQGVLISLTDDANFSMFEVGSIVPKPQLVRILGQIGRVLAKQSGDVEISGHTDGRSYKSVSYDNWRLSSDRANMVNHMLVRGGLPASRVAKITGFADKRLKAPKDPLAAVNRRIEIFIRGGRR